MTTTTFFFIFIPILGIILLLVNLIFAPHKPNQEKDSSFECGFHSFLGQNRTQFSVSFFIFGLLFLLFDLEILLVFPYIVSGYTNDIFGLIMMLIFFLLLVLGFVYELGKKALVIDSKQYTKKVIISNIKSSDKLPPPKVTIYKSSTSSGVTALAFGTICSYLPEIIEPLCHVYSFIPEIIESLGHICSSLSDLIEPLSYILPIVYFLLPNPDTVIITNPESIVNIPSVQSIIRGIDIQDLIFPFKDLNPSILNEVIETRPWDYFKIYNYYSKDNYDWIALACTRFYMAYLLGYMRFDLILLDYKRYIDITVWIIRFFKIRYKQIMMPHWNADRDWDADWDYTPPEAEEILSILRCLEDCLRYFKNIYLSVCQFLEALDTVYPFLFYLFE